MRIKTGLGQDSHRFDFKNEKKALRLAGVVFAGEPPLQGNSDADVVLHALTNAISGITGINILGTFTDELCLQQGLTDSQVYVQEALKYLQGWKICHVSFSIEGRRPPITPKIPAMKTKLAQLLGLAPQEIGITATTGEGLTDFGRGEGLQVLCIVTAVQEEG